MESAVFADHVTPARGGVTKWPKWHVGSNAPVVSSYRALLCCNAFSEFPPGPRGPSGTGAASGSQGGQVAWPAALEAGFPLSNRFRRFKARPPERQLKRIAKAV
jgi:hypothetical protein